MFSDPKDTNKETSQTSSTDQKAGDRKQDKFKAPENVKQIKLHEDSSFSRIEASDAEKARENSEHLTFTKKADGTRENANRQTPSGPQSTSGKKGKS